MSNLIKTSERIFVLLGLTTLSLTCVIAIAWAATAPIHSAVVAPGNVVVASKNKVVQHLDGGLVNSINVKEGDQVTSGQLLMSLHAEPLEIEIQQVKQQEFSALANIERLKAEQSQEEALEFSTDLQNLVSGGYEQDILLTQQQLFTSRAQSHRSRIDVLQQRVAQSQQQIKGKRDLVKSMAKRLRLVEEDLAAVKKLADKNLASQTKRREILASRVELESEILEYKYDIAQLNEEITETHYQIIQTQAEYEKDILSQLHELQAKRIDMVAKRKELVDKAKRIEIRSPASGKVKGFEVVTPGAVIAAGKVIMEIVPNETTFDIHARISPMDIDALYPGLSAEIRFNLFDGSQHLPSFFADLTDISTDTYTDRDKEDVYYKATLRVSNMSLEKMQELELELVSGMPLDVLINTGDRTLLEYLIKPFDDMFSRAFNEA